MHQRAFHDIDLSQTSVLVTGGAGFIGSHIVEYLVNHGVGRLRILDNLSEGKLSNIEDFIDGENVEFLEADTTDADACRAACSGVQYVCHQAALGSVPRSIADPWNSHDANVNGFVNMLMAAEQANARRFVYASSSSVYGDSATLPKVENITGDVLSPYAATKAINELYAGVFAKTYSLPTIGLRYFNVFGPRQKPDGPYAAVIPLFIDALTQGAAPSINGDGEQSRDFTFVTNAVQSNIRALFTTAPDATNRVYNIATGQRTTINELFSELKKLLGSELDPIHRPDRAGDIKHSLADISLARKLLQYNPEFDIQSGLQQTLDWFQQSDT